MSIPADVIEKANAEYASVGANAGRTAADFKHLPAFKAAAQLIWNAAVEELGNKLASVAMEYLDEIEIDGAELSSRFQKAIRAMSQEG